MSSLIGRTLGQYEVIELLGRGGMATVYKGRQRSVDRFVAIKVLPPHPGLDEQFKERFQLEARTIGGLQNPNILPLYDYGMDNDVLYLVMAYVEGGTLEDLLDSGPMDVREAEKIVRAIASGLDYAHRRGIIHRDIKPANILMSEGHPLLADFGMVKMIASSSNLTGTAIVGTPGYMAPEQGQGLEVDERVDIYALGVMVYEMLGGRQPFSGDTPMQVILKHINEPIPDIRSARPDLSPEVSAVLRKAMAKQPENRFQSAGEFAEAFSGALHKNSETLAEIQKEFPIEQGAPVRAVPPETIVLPPPSAGDNATISQSPSQTIVIRETTNPLVLLGVVGIIAIMIVVIAIMLINNQNPAAPATPTVEAVVENTPQPTAVVVSVPTFGEVRYSTANALGDTINIRLSGARQPGADLSYVAWLLNTESGEALALGRVIVDSLGEGGVIYTDPEGRLLPAHFNSVRITAESEVGATPAGDVIYSAEIPITVSAGIQEIFVTSPDGLGGNGSLLNGLLTEANFAAQHAGLAASATNLGGIQSHSEHTINILRGERQDYNNNGSGENPGRGIGVYFFLDAIDSRLQAATDQPEASRDLQVNAEFIRVCTQNIRLWSDEVVVLEQAMIASASVEEAQDEAVLSTTLMDHVINGFDTNQNGAVEAFEGECGIPQISEYGLQFARMDVTEAQP